MNEQKSLFFGRSMMSKRIKERSEYLGRENERM